MKNHPLFGFERDANGVAQYVILFGFRLKIDHGDDGYSPYSDRHVVNGVNTDGTPMFGSTDINGRPFGSPLDQ